MKRLLLSAGTFGAGYGIYKGGMMHHDNPPKYVQTLCTQKAFWKGLGAIVQNQSNVSNLHTFMNELETRMANNPNFFVWAHADRDFCTNNLTKKTWKTADKLGWASSDPYWNNLEDHKKYVPNNKWFMCLQHCQKHCKNEKVVQKELLAEMQDFITTQETFAKSCLNELSHSTVLPEIFLRGAIMGVGSAMMLTAPMASAAIGSVLCLASITKIPARENSTDEWQQLYNNLSEKKRKALNKPLASEDLNKLGAQDQN